MGSQRILTTLFLLLGIQTSFCAQSNATVTINNQIRLKKNLNKRGFRNGDSILLVKTKDECRAAELSKTPMCCF